VLAADRPNRIDGEWRGHLYGAHTAHHRRHDPPFIEHFKAADGATVLDIGCGDGSLTAMLAAAMPAVSFIGIDSAPDMIATASRCAAPNLRFELLRAQDLDSEEVFDVAISIAALHWIPAPDHPQFLKRIYRSLKPGGQFLADFGGVGNVSRTIGILTDLGCKPPFASVLSKMGNPWYFPSPEIYMDLLHGAGFTNISAELVAQSRAYTREEFEGWIVSQTVLPWTARLDDDSCEMFTTQAVLDASAAAFDGKLYYETFKRIRITSSRE